MRTLAPRLCTASFHISIYIHIDDVDGSDIHYVEDFEMKSLRVEENLGRLALVPWRQGCVPLRLVHPCVEGAAFSVWGFGFGIWGSGFVVKSFGFGVWGLGLGVWGLVLRVWC